MKTLLKIVLPAVLCSILCGCSGSGQQEPAQTVTIVEEPAVIQTSIPVSFMGAEFDMPLDMAIYHTPNTMSSIENDVDECFFDYKGIKEDVCLLRAGKLSSPVTSTEQADSVMKQFCQPQYYGGVDAVYDETQLYEVVYTMNVLVTGIDDRTYMTFTMIPKGKDLVYSITYKCDEDEQILVQDQDVKLMLNSLQKYTGENIKEDFFYNVFTLYIKTVARELISHGNMPSVPPLKDERSVVVIPDQQFFLELKTGLYSIEVVEGEGEVIIEDQRFGTRSCLMGYNSANAPAALSDVTLVHGGKIQTNMSLKIRITK